MNQPWLAHYPPGVVHTINPDQYCSITELLLRSIRRHTDAIAFESFGHALSYGQLDKLSQQLAACWHKKGFKKGDCVAVMLPNCLQYPVVLLAAWRLGLIITNINPLYTAEEVLSQCQDARPKGIIVLDHYAHIVEAVVKQYTFDQIFVTGLEDLLSFFKRLVVRTVVTMQRLVPKWRLPEAIPFLVALKEGIEQEVPEVNITGDDTALLQYTGGTTGKSKGAVLSHRNVVANMLQVQAWLAPTLRGEQVISIVALPLYHIFSLTANLLLILEIGGKSVLVTDPRNIPRFIRLLSKTPFHVLLGVNTLFNHLLQHKAFSSIDFSSLKVALAGGMALQASVAEQWQAKTKHPLLQGYGLTETSPVVSVMPLQTTDYTGSIGLPIPSTDVLICDELLKPVKQGEVGELWVRGPQVMQGYFNQPNENAKVFAADGWLRTGDMVYMDEKGFLYLVDRKKDMIIVSGFNVYPNEVEAVIAKHKGVLEVAVVGHKLSNGNEIVKACIVRKNGGLNDVDIKVHCEQWLTAYKIPKMIEFHNDLPKSAVGKILRQALR